MVKREEAISVAVDDEEGDVDDRSGRNRLHRERIRPVLGPDPHPPRPHERPAGSRADREVQQAHDSGPAVVPERRRAHAHHGIDWLGPDGRLAQHDMDLGSVLGAVMLSLLYAAVVFALVGGLSAVAGLVGVPLVAIKMLLRSAIQLIMLLAFVFAILSWVQPHAPVMHLLSRLVEPLLAPIRRVLPLIGGVDLSVLVLILLMQVGLIVLG